MVLNSTLPKVLACFFVVQPARNMVVTDNAMGHELQKTLENNKEPLNLIFYKIAIQYSTVFKKIVY